MERTHVTEHFDEVASSYDYWKQKNWYYYDALKDIAKRETAGALSVFDAGCGTGGIISTLTAPRLLGLDISPQMIAIAAKRHAGRPELSFAVGDISSASPAETFDRILFFDVIEHVEDGKAALSAMAKLLSPKGRLILTMANPLWEPILMLAEKLKLKMPEGPHLRISSGEVVAYAQKEGLRLVSRDFRLLFPKYIPVFSYFFNEIVGRLPLVRRLCVIEVFAFAHSKGN